MIYFAYGSNMFTYRLEKRIGKVEIMGIGKLYSHQFKLNKPSKDESLKANAFFTGQQDDYVYGILFKISPARRKDLDAAEGLGKGYDEKKVTIQLVNSEEEIEAFTYYATDPDNTDTNLPYDWYIKLIIAGAEEHYLPHEYIDFLKEIKCKADKNEGRRDTNLYILKESQLPIKVLAPTIDLVNTLDKSKQCNIRITEHPLDGRSISMRKTEHGFSFQTDSKIQKGIQTHKELNVAGKQIVLDECEVKWIIEGKDFLLNNISYDTDNNLKILQGNIHAIHSQSFSEGKSFFRLIIPISERLRIQNDYEHKGYTVNYKLYGGLMELIINENTFHYYSIKFSEKDFLIIECVNSSEFKDFQKASHCILMTYAFLTGPYNSGEGYFFSYEDAGLNKPIGVLYYSMSQTLKNDYGIFTTNPFIGIDVENLQRNDKGEISEEEQNKLYKDIRFFPASVFSKICQFAFCDEKILRTMTLLINNQAATLEMKLPVQYVTLETLTAALVKDGNSELKPVQNDIDANDLVQRLNKVVQDFSEEKSIEIGTLDPILRKIKDLNSPPNADKLSKVFGLIGYTLSEEETKVLKSRNKFLHGSMPTFGDFEDDFKELFHLSLRLHFLIAILLLKKAGFSGRIINYAKLHSVITGKYLDEPVLKMI